jgi:hypothetical protein
LGEKHAGDNKPVLAAALETAFDPAKSDACIGLARDARENAAAWVPPAMAYAADLGDGADPQADAAADIDDLEAEVAETGLTDAELPAFLTEDEAAGITLNAASAR